MHDQGRAADARCVVLCLQFIRGESHRAFEAREHAPAQVAGKPQQVGEPFDRGQRIRGGRDQDRALRLHAAGQGQRGRRTAQGVADDGRRRAVVFRDCHQVTGEVGQGGVDATAAAVCGLVEGDHRVSGVPQRLDPARHAGAVA